MLCPPVENNKTHAIIAMVQSIDRVPSFQELARSQTSIKTKWSGIEILPNVGRSYCNLLTYLVVIIVHIAEPFHGGSSGSRLGVTALIFERGFRCTNPG